MRLSTKTIHIGLKYADPNFGSVAPPIYPSSTFRFPSTKEGALRFSGKSDGMIYSRITNPTVQTLEKRLASLEGGETAIATSSGMSAITLVLLHFLKSGDKIIAHQVIYGGSFELIARILPKFGIEVKFIDFKNLEELEKTIDKKTKIIYFESPTNPLLEVLEIRKIAQIAKKHKILTVFDNTFAPPPIQFPLKLGVDLVIHSLTKYINGHSDVIAGCLIGSKKHLSEILKKSYPFLGPALSPFAAYLILRGMATLEERIKKHNENALKIAQFLEKHPKVKRVYYPGLTSHPYHQLAKKQMKGFGGVLSFEVKGGYRAGEKLANSVKLINLAVSLGAVESLIEHPASMTHSELTPQERKKSQINDGLLRLSVGLEAEEDLIADLGQALKNI